MRSGRSCTRCSPAARRSGGRPRSIRCCRCWSTSRTRRGAAGRPGATEGRRPRGVLIAGSVTAFFAFMMLLGHRQSVALEKQLRREGPAAAPEGPAAAPGPPAAAVTRGDLLRSLGRGARNGAVLGAGAALSLWLLPWLAGTAVVWNGASARMNLRPVILAAIPVLAVL